jgi:competence protein ComEA
MSLFHSLLLSLLLLPAMAAAEPVNLNTADAATLARELKGVGETRAQAIVDHRAQHGPFRSVEELALVKGIGPKVIEQNRANLRVDRAPRAVSAGVPPAGASSGAQAPPASSRSPAAAVSRGPAAPRSIAPR